MYPKGFNSENVIASYYQDFIDHNIVSQFKDTLS